MLEKEEDFVVCSEPGKCSFLQIGAYLSNVKEIPHISIMAAKARKKSRTGKLGGFDTLAK